MSIENRNLNTECYKDRDGNLVPIPISNNGLIEKMFSNAFYRGIMRIASSHWFSNLERFALSTFFSSFSITKFVRKNGINLKEYKKKKYASFHEFFYREIRPECRPIALGENNLVSPCDCKASVYRISEDSGFVIKGVPYTVSEVLADKDASMAYNGGYLFLLRLSLDDYHHYCYPISGAKTEDCYIPGKLMTVHPIIHKYAAVYRENARQYCVIRNDSNGQMCVVMQVGALGVGRIANDNTDAASVRQGEEQGHFEFGGSTILVIVPKESYVPDDNLLRNTEDGYETVIKMGERIGTLSSALEE